MVPQTQPTPSQTGTSNGIWLAVFSALTLLTIAAAVWVLRPTPVIRDDGPRLGALRAELQEAELAVQRWNSAEASGDEAGRRAWITATRARAEAVLEGVDWFRQWPEYADAEGMFVPGYVWLEDYGQQAGLMLMDVSKRSKAGDFP